MQYTAVCGGVLTVLLAGAMPAAGQEIVHALSGTVQKIDTQARTIQLKTNDGSEGIFQFPSSAKTEVDFDRNVQGRTTPISKFSKTGESVVLFFYGNQDSTRTAIAAQDLGSGSLDIVEGNVTSFNRKQRKLSIKTSSGAEQSFVIDPKAMADTAYGAISADKFSPSKGDNVRVIAAKAGAGETALFIRD